MPTLTELSAAASWDRLAAAYTVLLAFAHDGDVHVMPVNAGAHDQQVWFRTTGDNALRAAGAGARMAVAIEHHDAFSHTGWSVTARGPARVAPEGPGTTGQATVRPWRGDARDGTWVCIAVDTITGRQLAVGGTHTGGPP